MKRLRFTLLAVPLLFGLPPVAASQTLRVRVLEEETLTPIPGALVGLQGTSGKVIVRVMANDFGRLVVTAPGPGIYRLRGDRIGHPGRTSDTMQLKADEIRNYTLLLPTTRLRLAELAVTAVSVCGRARDSSQIVATLWEEARKALLASEITRATGQLELEVQSYELHLTRSLGVREVLNRSTRTARTERPFAAVPESVLRTFGFARPDDKNVWYYAPDAELLLSDYFLETHCFRAVAGKGALEGLVGIGFEPTSEVIHPDVTGVLWLRHKDGGLDHIEYTYTRLELPEPARYAGGRVVFARVGGGQWYVRQWCIRGPLVRAFSGDPAETPFAPGLAGYLETGGRAIPLKGPTAPEVHATSAVAAWCKDNIP